MAPTKCRACSVHPRGRGEHAPLTLAHEIGHFLDSAGFMSPGPGVAAASVAAASPAWQQWRQAIGQSAAVLALQTAQVTHPAGAVSDYLRYLLDLPEIWARAYAQYIAIRSGNAALGRALAAVRSDPDMLHPGVHWTDADFTPIATAIDDLFKEVGWRR